MNQLTENLRKALKREKPDAIPFMYGATKEAHDNILNYLGKTQEDDLVDYFGCSKFSSPWELFESGPSMPERNEKNQTGDPNVKIDIWGVKRELTEAGDARYFEISESPLASAETVADIENYDWPTVDEVVFPELPAGVNLAEWKKDKIVLSMAYICPFGTPWSMRGMEQLMMDLYLNPGIVEAIVNKVEEFTIGCLEVALKKYPGLIDLIGSGDDYGTQNGLLISPDSIQQFFIPSLKRHYDLGKKHGTMGYHHSCGAIFDIIPLMIDAGLEILNPLQTSAIGMDPMKLKKEFGKDLCFHGGIDTQQTLVTGTPEDVKAEVRERIDVLGPEGYILSPSHTLQADVPAQNIVAMYEEAKEYGSQI
jgi:uroporphyrinogen decarboxylase